MEDEVVAKALHGGDGGELAVGKVEAGPEPVAQALDGGKEEEVQKVAAFAEDPTQGSRHGEDELPVGDLMADGVGDPVSGLADPALMAGGAEVAALAGESEELLMAAVGALEAGESGGEVAAAEEGLDGGDGGGAERTEGLPVVFFVVGEKIVPAVLDELPEGRGAGAAGLVDGRHKECS